MAIHNIRQTEKERVAEREKRGGATGKVWHGGKHEWKQRIGQV